MTKVKTFEDAVQFLRSAVKFSKIKNQKHIDPALVNAEDLGDYQKAMVLVRHEVDSGKISQDDLKNKLGLD